ncbi:Uncharacterised protein [Mycobacteroides abscessus subsp. abscessus]|nr:Uncharacterised protein [Mycobacteroides abscessus subsp. abscessus]
MSARLAPTAAKAVSMLAAIRAAWAAWSPAPTTVPCSSQATWPDRCTRVPPVTATTWVISSGSACSPVGLRCRRVMGVSFTGARR